MCHKKSGNLQGEHIALCVIKKSGNLQGEHIALCVIKKSGNLQGEHIALCITVIQETCKVNTAYNL